MSAKRPPKSTPATAAPAAGPQVILKPLKPALIAGLAHTVPVLVRVQAPDADPSVVPVRRPYHLSLVIDRSGSMSGNPLQEAVRCSSHIVDRLLPTDVASLVTFDHKATLLAPAQPVGDRRALHRALAGIQCGGNTDLYGGWATGADSLLRDAASASIARIILLTDGNANAGELTEAPQIAERCTHAAARGITTSTYGLGRDFNETLMIAMARAGGGNHYYGDTAADLFEPFAEEFDLISNLYARHVRLSIATCPGVGMKVLNDYPVDARAGVPAISLPDIPWGAEAWVLVELSIPAGFVPKPGMPLLQAGVTGTSLERAPIAFPEALLAMDTVSPQVWDALTADSLVHSRHAEVEASRLLEQARTAADAGDWDRVQALIESAGRRFGDQPWVQEVLASLEQIARQRDQARFGKESLYTAMKMRSRVAAKDEGLFDIAREAEVPRFLRRDGSQGTKGMGRPRT
ncbi:MAG: VWA domain-containing protein [Burkholderiales bacterium]|nr:VWA domain-containing protein [Burkholderiales bacterium]